MAEKKRDVLEPAFDGGLLNAKFLIGGFFVVKNRIQRNSIKKLYRFSDGTYTTLCYVSADKIIYELINNPSTDSTSDSDWAIAISIDSSLNFLQTWDASNTDPEIFDTDAVGQDNNFYIVTGASSPTMVTIPGLFGGATTTVKNGDLVVSNGSRWYLSQSSVTWDTLDKPQVIVDYVNGIVIDHTHTIDQITGLQSILDEKFDENDVAPLDEDFDTIPDTMLMNLGFLKQYYYRKDEVYTKDQVDGLIPDLSDFYTKDEVDNLLDGVYNSAITYVTTNFYDKTTVDDKISDALSDVPGLIIGAVTLSERDALIGGVSSLNGYLLRAHQRVITTDPDTNKWVDEFIGSNGNYGPLYWTRLYQYNTTGGGGGTVKLDVDTSGSDIDFDFINAIDAIFVPSVDIDEAKTWDFLNDENALKFVFLFTITGAFPQTLPSNVIMSNSQWNSSAKQWTPIFDYGKYKLTAEFDGTNWWVDISQSNYI